MTTVRRPSDPWTAGAAAAAFVGLGVATRHGQRHDARLFAALNHDMSTRPVLRVPQQLGTPWMLPAVAMTGFLTHRPHLAVHGACALPLEKLLEVGVKKLLDRRRPAKVDPEAELRDDAPEDGPSYPSGHAAIAALVVLLPMPYVPATVTAAGVAVAGTTCWVRVRQGAHFPLDTLGGLLLGLTVSSTLRTAFGRPARPGR